MANSLSFAFNLGVVAVQGKCSFRPTGCYDYVSKLFTVLGPADRGWSRKTEIHNEFASNGLAIHVEEQGDGDLSLVFLHYWGGSSRTWKYVTAKLAPNFHTIALDHRGWGESDAPADGYALANLAADAEGVINALNLKSYVLVGHSMGGRLPSL